MKHIDFIYDFGSPNAYLCHKVLPDLLDRTGATITYIPCLLGGIFKATGNQSPFAAFAAIKSKLAYDQVEFERFVKSHRIIQFRMNSHFPVNTILQMRGAVAAREMGLLASYNEACFAGMWEQSKKMDDPEVFASVLTDAGLPGSALVQATQQEDVKAGLLENTQKAVERGVFGIPTFFVGDEMFFGKERLAQVENLLKSLA
jgi:2-hydroxychromene-2-carboxylate isomerase